MKIKVPGNEIVDASIEAVSLVKRGANRAPFKIFKSAYLPPAYARQDESPFPYATRAGQETERTSYEVPDPSYEERYRPIGREAAAAQHQRVAAEDLAFLFGRTDHSLDAVAKHVAANQLARRRFR